MGCFGPSGAQRSRFANRDNVKETFLFDPSLTRKEKKAAMEKIQDISDFFECTVIAGEGKGDGANQFNEPHCLFIDAARNLYVSDRLNHRVEKISLDAPQFRETVAGGNGFGRDLNQLDRPTGVYVDVMGHIFVADYGNNRVMKWIPGNDEGQVVCQVQHPKSIWMDEEHNLYISTLTYHGAVLKVNPYEMGMCVVRGGRKSESGTKNPIIKIKNKVKKPKENDAASNSSSSSSESEDEEDAELDFEDFLDVPEQVFVLGSEVVVANSKKNCISVIDQNTESTNKPVKTLVKGNRRFIPSHFVMDQQMGVYCTDDVKQSITRHGIDGTIQVLFKGDMEKNFNRGIAIDECGNIYAINWGTYDYQIVKISQKEESSLRGFDMGLSDPFTQHSPNKSNSRVTVEYSFSNLSPGMVRPTPCH